MKTDIRKKIGELEEKRISLMIKEADIDPFDMPYGEYPGTEITA